MIKPMKYKGKRKKNRYFEGWYYKSVTADGKYTVSLIPGISKNQIDPHAFIQVIINDHHQIKTEYVRFDMASFQYNNQEHVVSIDHNNFGLYHIELNIDNDQIKVHGRIDMAHHHPINTSILSPSIMGYFYYFPFMECNHDVVSMNHDLEGNITIDGQTIDFNQGRGYIEKDFGRSFPEAYTWIQSNHFSTDNVSLMFSYATIPYLGFKFKGFIINLLVKDKEYRFATYNFSTIKRLTQDEKSIVFEVRRGRYKLWIKAEDKDHIQLPSPKDGVMNQTIKEGLSGHVHLILSKDNQVLIDDVGKNAGIEIMM